MSISKSAETHPLTWRIDKLNGQLLDLKTYESLEGFSALRKAIKDMSPQDVQQTVKDANLRGRGGAGFPAGIKWSLVPMGDAAPKQKYLVCNADEMEPGTFKDRLLMEQLPHQLVEAMILAGYALQVSKAYIFLRGEYVLAAERLNRAIAEAKAAGYLGENILDSGWSMELFVHTGAGRYICGEETALINSLEGRRANPRAKPPFPQISGLWGNGIIQGLMWRAYNSDGTLTYSFVESVAASYPGYIVRLAGGVLFLTGMLIMAYNVWKTVNLPVAVGEEK